MATPDPGALTWAVQTKIANQIIALAEVLSRDGVGSLSRITALDIIALAEALRE